MKKLIVFFVLLTMIGCNSKRINLTGKFDVVVDNEVIGTLTIKHKAKKYAKITGFFHWDDTRRGWKGVYEIIGIFQYNPKKKSASVQITVIGDKLLYSLVGNASDSDSILGSFKYLTNPPKTESWIAIRK